MSSPLVTVICLCYNHDRFVGEALESVAAQSYKNIQLIIVDDASIDRSSEIISKFADAHPDVHFIAHSTNLGICKAFNSGLAFARGEFVIDLSADDVLLPDRVECGVAEFGKRDSTFGVQFGDATLVNERGVVLGNHSDLSTAPVPQGDVYEELIKRYFVDGPTTMVRKAVFDALGGYDESLAYEDFDFWNRSSRLYRYFYTPKVLVRQRIVPGALHEKQFTMRSSHAWSTLAVCRKILALNRTRSEQAALTKRVRYELRKAALRADFKLALEYLRLWKENRGRICDL